MTATRRFTDTLIIVVAILLVWQGLAQWVGETALPPGWWIVLSQK